MQAHLAMKLQSRCFLKKALNISGPVLTLVFIGFPFPGSAQSSGCFGFGEGANYVDEAHDIIQTSTGYLLVAGQTSQNNGDAYLAKVTPGSQNVIWAKTYGTPDKEEKAKAVIEHQGAFYFAGYTNADGNKDIIIARIDPSNGNAENHKVIGGSKTDEVNAIIETNSGNLAICGHTNTTNNQKSRLTFVFEFSMSSASFNFIREFCYGTNSDNTATGLTQDSQGDWWVVGYGQNNRGSGIIYQLQSGFSNNNAGDVIYKAYIRGDKKRRATKQTRLTDITNEAGSVIASGWGNFGNRVTKGGNLKAKGSMALKIDETANTPRRPQSPVSNIKAFGSDNNPYEAYGITANTNAYTLAGRGFNNNNALTFQISTGFSPNWNIKMGGGGTDFANDLIELNSGEFVNAGKANTGTYNSGVANIFLTAVTASGTNCCGNSDGNFRDYRLKQKSILTTSPPNNTAFQIDASKLSANIGSIQLNTTDRAGSDDFENNGGDGCNGGGALPVEFAGFEVVPKGNLKVQLHWKTASETNNDFFEVLRSQNGKTFKPIGRKEGQGTKLTATQYQHSDIVPAPGTYYYKIRQTDFDGSSSSSVVKTFSTRKKKTVKLSGVKKNGATLVIGLEGVQTGNFVLQVFNSQGKEIGEKTFKENDEVSKARFPIQKKRPGFYYISLTNRKTGSQAIGKKILPPSG